MPDFSKNELIVLQIALDTMVRTEGSAMSQAGINGLQAGRAEVLAERLGSAVSALGKINAALEAIDAPTAGEADKAEGG